MINGPDPLTAEFVVDTSTSYANIYTLVADFDSGYTGKISTLHVSSCGNEN